MREIALTRGLVTMVDDTDYDRLMAYGHWCVTPGPRTFYAVRAHVRANGQRTTIAMHSVLTGWAIVDHADGNGLNNVRANLREATQAENARNSRRRSDNRSGFRGVSWSRTNDKWRAVIRAGGPRVHLGYFATREQAARAYDAAARDLHGPFAALNFPQEIAS